MIKSWKKKKIAKSCKSSSVSASIRDVASGGGTVLPNGVKVAVSDRNQKCQKQTKVGSACSLQLY